ncbi:MAG: hypothetical protein LBK08_01005 [Treponema sp.]|jgi:hypothetical protein|nr:hypothetical protein [Treponema sp.]
MKKPIPFMAAVFLAAAALSCDFPQSPDGGKGYLTVLMAAEAPSGLYSKSSSILSGGSIASFTYKLTFTGPGGIVEQTARGGSASVALDPGEWNIEAKAYDSSDRLVGTGNAAASIAAGQPNTVALKMYVDSAYAASLTDIYVHSETELRDYISLYDDPLGTVTFHLENDITVNAPVEDLQGSFDGHGHTITLAISAADDTQFRVGLFRVNSGTIRNLRLEGSVTARNESVNGTLSVGAVASLNSGTIMQVASGVTVTVKAREPYFFMAGGIAGLNTGTIEDCSAGGDVTGEQILTALSGNPPAGGIAGTNRGTITRCYAWGKVFCGNIDGYIGGIAGENISGGTISFCAALNTSVSNDTGNPSPLHRITNNSGYSLNNNYAYEDMQVISSPVTGGVPGNEDGGDILVTILQDPGSRTTFWNAPSPGLDWPALQTTPPAGEGWYWGKTITIPSPGGFSPPVSPVYVPALWFE